MFRQGMPLNVSGGERPKVAVISGQEVYSTSTVVFDAEEAGTHSWRKYSTAVRTLWLARASC